MANLGTSGPMRQSSFWAHGVLRLAQHGLPVEPYADEIVQSLDVVGFEGIPCNAKLVTLLA